MTLTGPDNSLLAFLRRTNGMPIKFLTGTIVFIQWGMPHSVNTMFDVLRACLVFIFAYSVPVVELFEYREFGFVARWEGDFLPRTRRLLQRLSVSEGTDARGDGIEPPRLAEFLVGALAKRRYRAGLLQCLDHKFQSDLANGLSHRRARARYWAAALNTIGPQLWAAAKRVGLFSLLADYARRLLH
jgi:hypothetical protein